MGLAQAGLSSSLTWFYHPGPQCSAVPPFKAYIQKAIDSPLPAAFAFSLVTFLNLEIEKKKKLKVGRGSKEGWSEQFLLVFAPFSQRMSN